MMDRLQNRMCLLLLFMAGLTACQSTFPQKEPTPVTPAEKKVPKQDIYQLLRSEQALDRIEALGLLSKQPREARQAISLILALLADDRQVDVSKYVGSGFYSGTVTSPAVMAAELLSKLGRWSVLPLRLRLHDMNPVVRRYTIKSLGMMANPEHAEWILSAMADTDSAVSKEAYIALLKQDPQVYVKLVNKLDMTKMSVRQQLLLIQLLGNSRHGDALPVLFKFTEDRNPVLRSAVFVALTKYPEAHLQEIVLQGIQDSNLQVKETAILLAPHHKNKAVLAAVISQLRIHDSYVQEAALKVLPIMTDKKQRPANDWIQWWQKQSKKP